MWQMLGVVPNYKKTKRNNLKLCQGGLDCILGKFLYWNGCQALGQVSQRSDLCHYPWGFLKIV